MRELRRFRRVESTESTNELPRAVLTPRREQSTDKAPDAVAAEAVDSTFQQQRQHCPASGGGGGGDSDLIVDGQVLDFGGSTQSV